MALNNWMADFGNTELRDLIIPGAHDAGTYLGSELKGPGATQSNSITQHDPIGKQLSNGTRFFDLRLKALDGQVRAHHTTAGVGAYGDAVDRTILAAAAFCHENPTEVVIIRVTHTNVATDADQIIKQSSFYGGRNQLCLANGNLATKTLQQILTEGRTAAAGGGLICVLDSDSKTSKKFKLFGPKVTNHKGNFEHHGKVDQAAGIHPFHKYKGAPIVSGLATCGCYQGSHKLSQVIGNALRGGYDHIGHDRDHLWQIYWQKTYKNPFSRTGIQSGTEKGAHGTMKNGKLTAHGGTQAATGHLLYLLAGHLQGGEDYVLQQANKKKGQAKVLASNLALRQFRVPNIISYDFVNDATNAEIIAMNRQGIQFLLDD